MKITGEITLTVKEIENAFILWATKVAEDQNLESEVAFRKRVSDDPVAAGIEQAYHFLSMVLRHKGVTKENDDGDDS